MSDASLDGLDDHVAAHAERRRQFAALTMSERLEVIDQLCFELTSLALDAKRVR